MSERLSAIYFDLRGNTSLALLWSFVTLTIVIVSSCGDKSTRYDHPSAGGNYNRDSSQPFSPDMLLESENIGSRTMSVIQPDQYQTLAKSHAKSDWTPVFNDRFSLTTAGSPPFPAQSGAPVFLPSLFHVLAPLAAIKPMGNSLSCNANSNLNGCNPASRRSLCQMIISDLNLGTKQDDAIGKLYLYLTGEDLTTDDLTALKNVIKVASVQSIYKDPMEIVCFTIMQSPSFLTL